VFQLSQPQRTDPFHLGSLHEYLPHPPVGEIYFFGRETAATGLKEVPTVGQKGSPPQSAPLNAWLGARSAGRINKSCGAAGADFR